MTIVSIDKYGLGGHTAPIGFVIPLLITFCGILFLIADLVFKSKIKFFKQHLITDIISVLLNLSIVISIIYSVS